MNIRESVRNLLNLYDEMSAQFSSYQTGTGLHCLPGCGRCCLNPDVEATPFEMLPWALHVYDEGMLEHWLHKLDESEQKHCLLYVAEEDETKGRCGSYGERASICRMFGVAGYFDKNRDVTLSICKYIKDAHPGTIVPNVSEAPMMSLWQQKVSGLSPYELQRKMPINEAMKLALHKIANYAQYKNIDQDD